VRDQLREEVPEVDPVAADEQPLAETPERTMTSAQPCGVSALVR